MYLYFFFSYFSSPSIYHSERLERSWKINRILCVCFHLLLTHIFQCRCHSTGIRKNYSIITALLQRIAGAVVSLRYTQHTTHTRYTIQIECSVWQYIYCLVSVLAVDRSQSTLHQYTHTHTHMAWHMKCVVQQWNGDEKGALCLAVCRHSRYLILGLHRCNLMPKQFSKRTSRILNQMKQKEKKKKKRCEEERHIQQYMYYTGYIKII